MSGKNLVLIAGLAVTGVVAVAAGGWYYLRHSARAAGSTGQVATPANPSAALGPSAGPANSAAGGKIHTPPFVPLAAPPAPAFLNGAATASDVKVAFYYEGDERTPTDENFYVEKTAITNDRNEQYLLVPRTVDPNRTYGPLDFQVFKNQESHSYQGIPFSILNPDANYSLQYVGLKLNDARLISRLWVEMGIDYMADDDGDAPPNPNPSSASLSAWFTPPPVYACGPGLYLRGIGRSQLLPAKQEGDVAWYRLEKPIKVHSLPLNFCDHPPDPNARAKPKGKKTEEDEDEVEEYCAPIKDLARGHLRLHVSYQPNGVSGPLQIQVVNFILQDAQQKYYQPAIGANFSRYYKAFLVDPACMKSGKPEDCVSQ